MSPSPLLEDLIDNKISFLDITQEYHTLELSIHGVLQNPDNLSYIQSKFLTPEFFMEIVNANETLISYVPLSMFTNLEE